MIVIGAIGWEYEDEMPEMKDSEFDAIYPASRVVNGVRMYPYVIVKMGKHPFRVWLTKGSGLEEE